MIPEFDKLFPIENCNCNDENCERCWWNLTPRTAKAIWSTSHQLADLARIGLEECDGDPIDPNQTLVVRSLPRIAQNMNVEWYYQFARTFVDLAADLASGNLPEPRCIAEEIALSLVLSHARDAVTDDGVSFGHLPEAELDFDWVMCEEMFFQDEDFKLLYSGAFDGIDDPEAQPPGMGMCDMRITAWFKTFNNCEPRDPTRGTSPSTSGA